MAVELGSDGQLRLIAGRRFSRPGQSERGVPPEANDPRLTNDRTPTVHGSNKHDATVASRAGVNSLVPANELGVGIANSSKWLRGDGAWDENLHASEHTDGGADEITSKLDPRAYAVVTDDVANRPTATIANDGRLFYATDEAKLYINDPGGAWVEITPPVEAWQVVDGNGGRPSLQGTWVNKGGGEPTAAYYKDPFGVVHLRGTVKSGSVPSTIFTLPSGYRPPSSYLRFACIATDALGYIYIDSSGNVVFNIGSSTNEVDLHQISFRV